MLTKLIFIRHGEAEGNIARRFHGHYDSSLTENGKRQIALLAERLRDTHIDVVYASDLARAYQTAKAVADQHGLPVHTHPGLREIAGGEWEDVPFAELPERFPESYRDWVDAPYALALPGGETMAAFQHRLVQTVSELVARHEGQTICIATHGTAIRALVCYFYGEPLTYLNNIRWYDNASVTEIWVDGDRFDVVTEGDNAHLGDTTTLGKQTWWKRDGEEP